MYSKRYVLLFVDVDRYLTVDFGNSLNKAVLKFYPGVVEASSVSSMCLRFNVYISSRAVELLIAVLDISQDDSEVRSGTSVRQRFQAGTVSQSLTVVRGRQYVIFTAENIKVTRIPDRVDIKNIAYTDGSCINDSTGKYSIST